MIRFFKILPDCALGLHLLFIAWVVFGAFVARYHGLLRWLHIACLVWGILVELTPWPCPLTVLEQWLESQARVEPYQGGFLLHYLDKAVYPDVSPTLLTVVGVSICVLNLALYGRALLAARGRSR
jgi:hypothetical protein